VTTFNVSRNDGGCGNLRAPVATQKKKIPPFKLSHHFGVVVHVHKGIDAMFARYPANRSTFLGDLAIVPPCDNLKISFRMRYGVSSDFIKKHWSATAWANRGININWILKATNGLLRYSNVYIPQGGQVARAQKCCTALPSCGPGRPFEFC
jgi:hypothetical protein